MWCNLCKKHVRSISHWSREHKKYLAAKSRGARKKKGKGVLPRSGPVHRGRKREVHLTEAAAHRFCRQCGGRCPEELHEFCRYCGARCP